MQHVKNVKCQTPTVRTITMSKRDICKVANANHVKKNSMQNVKACQTKSQISALSTNAQVANAKCQQC